MTATLSCSEASGRFQVEKKVLSTIWKQQRQGPDAELVMKDKPLHALKCFLHLACKA